MTSDDEYQIVKTTDCTFCGEKRGSYCSVVRSRDGYTSHHQRVAKEPHRARVRAYHKRIKYDHPYCVGCIASNAGLGRCRKHERFPEGPL